jgi:uncharacterized membrane protein
MATDPRLIARRTAQRERIRMRRALLVDALAAIVLAVLVLSLTSGLGVVGFACLPILAAGLLWIGAERLRGLLRHR